MPELSSCPSEAGSAPSAGTPVPTPPGCCPVNGHPGIPVPDQTVKALLARSLRLVTTSAYRFCPDPQCPVVYFTADGRHTFTLRDLRERVYHKEPAAPDVWICYCFRYTVGDVRTADQSTQDALIADIIDGIQAQQCACDLRNPQGSCCLGNVRALIRTQRAD